MLNHTPKILSSEVINILCAEEKNLHETYKAKGDIEVDRILSKTLELIFDGYYLTGRRLALMGIYNLETKSFEWC